MERLLSAVNFFFKVISTLNILTGGPVAKYVFTLDRQIDPFKNYYKCQLYYKNNQKNNHLAAPRPTLGHSQGDSLLTRC